MQFVFLNSRLKIYKKQENLLISLHFVPINTLLSRFMFVELIHYTCITGVFLADIERNTRS